MSFATCCHVYDGTCYTHQQPYSLCEYEQDEMEHPAKLPQNVTPAAEPRSDETRHFAQIGDEKCHSDGFATGFAEGRAIGTRLATIRPMSETTIPRRDTVLRSVYLSNCAIRNADKVILSSWLETLAKEIWFQGY